MQLDEKRYNNEGVYALLEPPNLEFPSFYSLKAEGRTKVQIKTILNVLFQDGFLYFVREKENSHIVLFVIS